MSMTITTLSGGDTSDERWRQWPLGYATSSRRTAAQARIVFAVVLTTTIAWLAVPRLSAR
ncbi:MAG: hypothetical protein A3I61_16435 [Acidobacteria bacterium RIFCSPLOWO2_02_FULL_68_18]|nr:MAG: hypothetical protein A3I61_16435 [Acidobacteria bacterium RIFCSPLOWO2_02_FULL_68_18]OFW48595.1 MAG: hypothetical protein A3G77_13875 [Acidobacteria bacterium RIFCSPLOWO2_12_FULL_68_19]